MDLSKWVAYANQASIATVLVAALWAGQAGYWVFGTTYQGVVADRDQWKQLALRAMHVGERSGVVKGAAPPARDTTYEQAENRVRMLENTKW